MPAAGIVPTFGPGEPPPSQLTNPMTGAPVMPSPTSGSTSAWRIPTRNGQPSRYGDSPSSRPSGGSPVGLIAKSRPLASESAWPSAL
jgi:hypothetical protein